MYKILKYINMSILNRLYETTGLLLTFKYLLNGILKCNGGKKIVIYAPLHRQYKFEANSSSTAAAAVKSGSGN